MTDNLTAALDLASRGWAVLPCKWEGEQAKAPLVRNGLKDATTDPEQVERWWIRWPDAMIGGLVPDGLTVLDIDPRNGGSDAALADTFGHLPDTLSVLSGRNDGGCHLYYRTPDGLKITSTRLPRGVDLRQGGKAYCILPPSLHPATGQPYIWANERPPAWLPAAALRVLIPTEPKRPTGEYRSGSGRIEPLVRTIAHAEQGQRNNVLYWAAMRAREENNLDPETSRLLFHAAVCAGLPEEEAENTIRSAMRRTDL